MKRTSIWLDTGPEQRERPQLGEDLEADVVVIGGGIVGITTALLMQEAGVDVVLLEANRLACGVSGFTTAKVSSQHGLIYARLRSRFGPEAASAYGAANEHALAWMADRVQRDGIACDWRRRPSYAYLTRDRAKAEREAEAAADAGLPASFTDDPGLPYAVAGAVRFADQAEFHPRKYLLALADGLERVYERSHAVDVDVDERCAVKTPGGRLTADRIVVATH
jgi:glycine/D-amino acid oxidase-like deaminating enzyme